MAQRRPDVARPRSDQAPARILLLRVRDPANAAAQGKEPKCRTSIEIEVSAQHAERPIDVGLLSGRRGYRRGNGSRRGGDGALGLLQQIEEQARAGIAGGVERMAIDTNVEFYTALLLDALGVPREAMVSVFAMSRVAGWIAHALEQQRTGRIIRPVSRYIGPEPTASA